MLVLVNLIAKENFTEVKKKTVFTMTNTICDFWSIKNSVTNHLPFVSVMVDKNLKNALDIWNNLIILVNRAPTCILIDIHHVVNLVTNHLSVNCLSVLSVTSDKIIKLHQTYEITCLIILVDGFRHILWLTITMWHLKIYYVQLILVKLSYRC